MTCAWWVNLRGLLVPGFVGRVWFELGARRVACGIRNRLSR